VALSTKSQLEIRYMFKSFNELCEASEAFSFTFLQQVFGDRDNIIDFIT